MLLDLSSLPWLPLDRRNFFPCRPAVYLAISATNQILYIGRSEEVKGRWRSHEKLRHLKLLPNVRIAFIFTETKNLHNLEVALIREYNPTYNLRLEKARLDCTHTEVLSTQLCGQSLGEVSFLEILEYLIALISRIKIHSKRLTKKFFSSSEEEREKEIWIFSGAAELAAMGDALIDSIRSLPQARFLFEEQIHFSEVDSYLESLEVPAPQDFAQAVADLGHELLLFQRSHLL